MQVSITLQNDLISKHLDKLTNKLSDFSEELYDSGILMLRSFDLNFAQQGRPVSWSSSLAAINRQGMTLQDTGRLRRSVTSIISDTRFEVDQKSLTIGTNVPYAKYLYKKYPFMLFQREDIQNIISIFRNSIRQSWE